jgi:hypothetical protein
MSLPDTTRAAFQEWFDRILDNDIPHDVTAFVLHLYEGAATFDAQLAGTTRFDPTDRDWALDEAWSTGEDLFVVDRSSAGDSWELALDMFRELLRDYLMTGLRAERLRHASGIAVGFVDDDLTLISNRQESSGPISNAVLKSIDLADREMFGFQRRLKSLSERRVRHSTRCRRMDCCQPLTGNADKISPGC